MTERLNKKWLWLSALVVALALLPPNVFLWTMALLLVAIVIALSIIGALFFAVCL